MSMFDDYMAEAQFAHDFPFGLPHDTWTNKNGDKVAVKDMSDRYIKNCMNVVGEDDKWYQFFKSELEKRRNDE